VTDTYTQRAVGELVGRLNLRPVVVDVGASAGAPHAWMPFARHAVYVGFDPDLREMRETNGGDFLRAFVFNEAVAGEGSGPRPGPTRFFLTRAPQCSSTLRFDPAVVGNYLNAGRFEIEREVEVTTTTLRGAMDRLGLTAVDWLNVDTQGTDLRVIRSLGDAALGRLLAVDAEPGLRGAYVGEDLFGDVHRYLLGRGFWLASAAVKGYPRIRERTLAALEARDPAVTQEFVVGAVPYSPGWVECRYLRTIESLAAAGDRFDRREYLLLWAFALCGDHTGFAADVAMTYAERYGPDANAAFILDTVLRRLRSAWAARRNERRLTHRMRQRLARALQRVLRGKHVS
jgi:FkbM family methyltransferase